MLPEAPLEEVICEACDGRGYAPYSVTVYEHGCSFPHDDTDEQPCPECLGIGFFICERV